MMKSWGLDKKEYSSAEWWIASLLLSFNILIGLILTNYTRSLNFYHFYRESNHFLSNSLSIQEALFTIYGVLEIAYLIVAYFISHKTDKNLLFVSAICSVTIAASLSLMLLGIIDFKTINEMLGREDFMGSNGPFYLHYLKTFLPLYLILLVFVMIGILHKHSVKSAKFNVKSKKIRDTFGSAKFADHTDLKRMGAYQEEGTIFGKDSRGDLLRYHLTNRAIIAQPGGGKSAGLIIPALLTEDRPVFVHDVKGELWATTARHRSEKFGRKVVAIDPFGVLEQAEYREGKSEELLQDFTINPLDFIPNDERFRDRAITSLVQSMVVRERNAHTKHWEESAKILLYGLLEYILKKEKSKTLITLHTLLTLDSNEMSTLMKEMVELTDCPRAQAAASQILKVAPEERGSIYSTTYRQAQWLAESNMRKIFAASTFDLRDFINGGMDIYIVMPEDQVRDQSRVVRMIFSIITSALIQASPSTLPTKDFLFIFDELGQLEYCDDVEKGIEVLRARRVIIWAVFQTLTQIKMYSKPDLFTGAKVKQFFEVDDIETMNWIQHLGGKKTILSENASTNQGNTNQKERLFAGSSSKGKGNSLQETAADLIHLNEIRELAEDSQYVFIRGKRAIQCKKLKYFSDPYFEGCFDPNPLEDPRYRKSES